VKPLGNGIGHSGFSTAIVRSWRICDIVGCIRYVCKAPGTGRAGSTMYEARALV